MIGLTADTPALLRELGRIRSRAIPFAVKRATDAVGGALAARAGLIQREWDRTFAVRRRTFPSRVLRVRRARVTGDRVSRPTRVVNIAADELLADQLRGGVREPRRGRQLLLPAARGRKANVRRRRDGNAEGA